MPPAKALLDRVAIASVALILTLAFFLNMWVGNRADTRSAEEFQDTVMQVEAELQYVLDSTEQRLFDIRAYLGSSWPVSQKELERYVELSYDARIDRTERIFVATRFGAAELDEYEAEKLVERPEFEILMNDIADTPDEFLIVTASAIQRDGAGVALHDLDVGAEVSGLWSGLDPNDPLDIDDPSLDKPMLRPVGPLFLVTSAEMLKPELMGDVVGAETLGIVVIRSLEDEVVGVAALVLDISQSLENQITGTLENANVSVAHTEAAGGGSLFTLGNDSAETAADAVHAQEVELSEGGHVWTALVWSSHAFGDTQTTARILLWLGAVVSAAIAYTGIILRRTSDMRMVDAEVKYAESKRMLRLDGLTGQRNRAGIHEAIASALENKSTSPRRDFATIFLDLNEFKAVNDTYGHEVGDEMLRRTGAALRSALRSQDSIGRIGGDEFVAICLNIRSLETADRLARDIHAAICEIQVEVGGKNIGIQASIGVNITPIRDRIAVAEVLSRADAAMYDAKRSAGSERTRVTLGSQTAKRNTASASVPERRVISELVSHRTPITDSDGELLGEMIEPHLSERGGAKQLERVFRADASSALRQHTARWLANELQNTDQTGGSWLQWVRLPPGGLDEIFLREFMIAWQSSENSELSFVVSEADLDRRISRHPRMLRLIQDMGIYLVVDNYGLGTIPIPRFDAFSRVRTLLVSPELRSDARSRVSLFDAVSEFATEYELQVAVRVPSGETSESTPDSISMVLGTVPAEQPVLLA